jgi:hypothetical protein
MTSFGIHTRINDWIHNRITLNSFFRASKSKIIHCKVPSVDLIQYIIDLQNPFKQVNDLIELAANLDLDYVDSQLTKGKQLAYDTEWIDNWQDVRQSLKFGYLIQELKRNGQRNPMQLLASSTKNKYAVHPGSVRLAVLIASLEVEYCELIYCWDQNIDPTPFIFNYDTTEITNARQFFRLFRDNFVIYREILFSNKNTENKGGATKLQKQVLTNCSSAYDFLTTFDSWDKKVEKRILFKDVYEFHSDISCTIGGVNFIKNKVWVKA